MLCSARASGTVQRSSSSFLEARSLPRSIASMGRPKGCLRGSTRWEVIPGWSMPVSYSTTVDARGAVPGGGRGRRVLRHTRSGSSMRAGWPAGPISAAPVPARSNHVAGCCGPAGRRAASVLVGRKWSRSAAKAVTASTRMPNLGSANLIGSGQFGHAEAGGTGCRLSSLYPRPGD
jgi:hypothetical protein